MSSATVTSSVHFFKFFSFLRRLTSRSVFAASVGVGDGFGLEASRGLRFSARYRKAMRVEVRGLLQTSRAGWNLRFSTKRTKARGLGQYGCCDQVVDVPTGGVGGAVEVGFRDAIRHARRMASRMLPG